jgi:hypothetical protein
VSDSPLLRRLTEQLRDAGRTDPRTLAMSLLVDRGHIDGDGRLTVEGQRRQDMGAAGRAKDRAARQAGRDPSSYRYDPATNRARLR